MTKVIVVGGGYGGITAAKALDAWADVTLVEPRERFVHNVASRRPGRPAAGGATTGPAPARPSSSTNGP